MNSALQVGVFTQDAVQKLLAAALVALPASGAVDPHTANRYIITKAGVAALTLAAPTAGADDGLLIQIASATANAHTVTTAALFEDGTANTNVLTFPAHAGASALLMAYQGKWIVLNEQATSLTS
ncbi:MAG TPA: hypothetical protein VGG46_04000 [Terriglobales bacterium]|jgi:hypothetical protein